MTKEELKAAAASLPYEPGVYLMKNAENTVIYVGKAKKLRNRVSQYFQDTASHNAKTRRMVSLVDHFETIRAASEFEALVLECSLIKHYMPKYNILLKDDKGYPYLRLDMREPYPVITLTNRVKDDGAKYFGPYGSRGRSNQVIRIIRDTFRLPDCSKKFPRDRGKERPCLNFHMEKCEGWCREEASQTEYRSRMEQAQLLLEGKYKPLCEDLKRQMEQAASAATMVSPHHGWVVSTELSPFLTEIWTLPATTSITDPCNPSSNRAIKSHISTAATSSSTKTAVLNLMETTPATVQATPSVRATDSVSVLNISSAITHRSSSNLRSILEEEIITNIQISPQASVLQKLVKSRR